MRAPIAIPVGFEREIVGIVDLVKMKTFTYEEFHDKELVEGEIPADLMEKAKQYRHELLEKVVEFDDVLMEKYLAGGEFTEQELRGVIRKATISERVLPSARRRRSQAPGVKALLDAVVDYLPSPADKADTSALTQGQELMPNCAKNRAQAK